MRGPTSDEPSAYLTGGIEFTPSKRPSSSDGIPWSTIGRSLRFEQGQDSLSTVRRPRCDEAAVGFAQRLWGRHASSFARGPAGRSPCGLRGGDSAAKRPPFIAASHIARPATA